MKKTLWYFLIFTFLSCQEKTSKIKVLSRDTTYLRNDAFLFYENLSDTTYRLAWGENDFKNYSPIIRVLPSGKPNLYFVSSKAIGMRQGYGSACFYAYVLPLLPKANEITTKTFEMNPHEWEMSNNHSILVR